MISTTFSFCDSSNANVDLNVRRGEVHCLAGENGCGKSTIIKAISGFQPQDSGTIEFNGTADIVLREKEFSFGQEITLEAKVTNIEMSYRLVWEVNDGDERGWYTIASGPEYSFTVTPEMMEREFRVVLFAVD